jgi:hypothetical protein
MEDYEILDLIGELSEIGLAETPLDKRLRIYKKIQSMRPGCHIGGSIGLFLHGIDLGRNFADSDLDVCVSSPSNRRIELTGSPTEEILGIEESTLSSSSDMDETSFNSDLLDDSGTPIKIKIEYKLDPTQPYTLIEYKGNSYRVTKPEVIIGWKILFAMRGSKKNIEDLEKIGVEWRNKFALKSLPKIFRRMILFNGKWGEKLRSPFKTWEDLNLFLKN